MRLIYHFLLFFAFWACGFSLNAQAPSGTFPGKISGTIKDTDTKKPVEYTTVSLFKASDNKLVTGMISDKLGEFVLDNIPPGNYYLSVSFIGYKTVRKDSIQIGMGNMEQNVGNIFIKTSPSTWNQSMVF